MGLEIEWKFAASAEVLEALAAQAGPWETVDMETTYFDTPDRALSARRRTLRVRLENGAAVAAFKTPDLGHGRGEWEVPGADPRAALAAAGETVEGPLVPVCGARFQRRRRRIPTGDGTAELALDAGVLTGGGREVPFQEVEVELKSGSREAAEKTARSLAARFSLTEEPRSKFRRAMDLAGG